MITTDWLTANWLNFISKAIYYLKFDNDDIRKYDYEIPILHKCELYLSSWLPNDKTLL